MRGSLSRRAVPDPSAFERGNYIKTLSSFTLRRSYRKRKSSDDAATLRARMQVRIIDCVANLESGDANATSVSFMQHA